MKIPFIIVCILLFPSLVHAGSCDRNMGDKAEYFAEIAGDKLVKKFGGGQDIRVLVNHCKFNSYSKKFQLEIEVHWNGNIFSSNHYEIDGKLIMKSDGSQSSFSETYANGNVDDLRMWAFIGGSVIVLGVLANQSANEN